MMHLTGLLGRFDSMGENLSHSAWHRRRGHFTAPLGTNITKSSLGQRSKESKWERELWRDDQGAGIPWYPRGPADDPAVQGCRACLPFILVPARSQIWSNTAAQERPASHRWAPRRAAPGSRGDISVQHFDQGSSEPAPGAHTKTHSGGLLF